MGTETPPLCPCHDISMEWARDKGCRAGGYWRCVPRTRAAWKRWREGDVEAYRAADRRRYAANPERGRESSRRWRQTDQAKAYRARYQRRRDALKASLPTDGHTRQQVWERDGGVCQICGVILDPRRWHEDHIVPITRGGPDTLDNVQATCQPCNNRKYNKVAA